MYKKNALTMALILMVSGTMLMSTVAFAQEGTERRPTREGWEEMTIEAVVESIDPETRQLLLRGPKGDLATVTASENVTRFNEIEVGDVIKTQFWTYIKAEFREPTAAEKAEPLVVIGELGKAAMDKPPAAAVGETIKAVVTIEVINRPDMFVVVKGPRGNYLSIPVLDKDLITQLKVGEVVVMTYAEAIVFMLEKIER